jgi:mRNA-decapping enzyme subunit 2
MRYKTRVPVCGAIMLNDTWDKVKIHIVLLWIHQLRPRGSGGAGERLEVFFGMGFPKREDQSERASSWVCRARGTPDFFRLRPTSWYLVKVAEETGYNLTGKINPERVIEMEIREQQISLFVVSGIPEDFQFETKTRKEISVSEHCSYWTPEQTLA